MDRKLSKEETKALTAKPLNGGRLTMEDGRTLLEAGEFHELGAAAHELRLQKADPESVTYIVDRNINYTNVCVTRCRFCAFARSPEDPDAYLHPYDPVIKDKIEEAVSQGATQILMQGGHNPCLPIEWYEEITRNIKQDFPSVQLHSFSAPEMVHIARQTGLTPCEVLLRLQNAGLDSLPGGGAEILVQRVRDEVSPRKATVEEWLGVMRDVHRLGMKTTATMVFGHVETLPDRIEHLERIRELQDETGGFTAFICWPFQPENTPLGGVAAGGLEYLRMLAVSRLYLDNFVNLQASWVTMGPKIGQIALYFGANDMGGTMLEENVVAAAGTHFCLTEDGMRKLITDAGFTPVKRATDYTRLE